MSASSPTDPESPKGGVIIGDVHGDIRDTIIAGGNVTIGQKITNFILGGSEQQRTLRNRQAMLQLVRNTWIKGVLEQSLHGAAMIELGMEERADAVERPWDMIVQMPDQPTRKLPHGTRIIDVFDEMNQALLILGEPGSGKTTMLLELARDAIERAEQDLSHPIPVVFNLSSWAEKRQPIGDWLVKELSGKYHVPKKDACVWVENNEMLLLLDGLDEVEAESRNDCVAALNAFRKHSTQMVVCSRIADYGTLTARLSLCGAVFLQPLTAQQIDQYLTGTGAELLAVRGALEHDPALGELARTPVMLSIMTLAYHDRPVEDLAAVNSVEATRRHLFAAYVERMFERRSPAQPYTPKRAVHWLTWIAQYMSDRAQSVFLIERLQPVWLRTRLQKELLVFVVIAVSSLFGVLASTTVERTTGRLVSGLVGHPAEAFVAAIISGLIGALIARPANLKDETDCIKPTAVLKWSWRNPLAALIHLTQRILEPANSTQHTPGYHPTYTRRRERLVIHLDRQPYFAESPDDSDWLGPMLLTGITLLFFLCVFGLAIGGILFGPTVGSIAGLLFWPILLLVGTFVLFLRRAEIEPTTEPNQSIKKSARNALNVWIVVGLIGALAGALLWNPVNDLIAYLSIIGLMDGSPTGAIWGFLGGLLLGLVVGLFPGLEFGGRATIQHIAVRIVLSRNGCIPWNLPRFLDYAAERIFLRKVGGGYIFVHRLLMEYFASLGDGEDA